MKKIVIVLYCIVFSLFVFAQKDMEMNAVNAKTDVAIKFYDRRIYYPGDGSSDPIFVQLSVTNKSAETYRFKLADDRSFSVDFSVINTKNRKLKHTQNWLRKRNTNRQIYFREISIEPGETYSFIENVKDYIDITEPGVFLLNADFFPELKRMSDSSEQHINSNRLSLEIKPAPSATALGSLPVSPATGDILQTKPIPPDPVS